MTDETTPCTDETLHGTHDGSMGAHCPVCAENAVRDALTKAGLHLTEEMTGGADWRCQRVWRVVRLTQESRLCVLIDDSGDVVLVLRNDAENAGEQVTDLGTFGTVEACDVTGIVYRIASCEY